MKQCRLKTASQTIVIPAAVYCRFKNSQLIPEPEQIYTATGTFSFKLSQKIPSFKADDLQHLSSRNILDSFGGKMQRYLRDGLNMVLPTRHSAVVTGFLLGDTSQIERKDRQLFRETGISHLLAVSGQHIMILSLVIAACLHWLRVPPISRSIFICIFLTVYAFSTTGSPSIIRALLMYAAAAVIFHLESAPSPIRPVSIAALLILLYDPSYISDAAFILSFTAVLGIILLRPMFEHYFKKLHLPALLARYFSVAIAANLAVMPMAAYLFGTVSIIAMLVNPAIAWLFSIILPISFVLGITSAISPEYGLFLAPGLSIPLDGFLGFLEKAQTIPGGFFQVGNVPGLLTALIYCGLILWAGLWNRRMVLRATNADTQNSPKMVKHDSIQDQSIRTPQGINKESTNTREAATKKQGFSENLSRDFQNAFRDGEFVKDIDAIMISCKRRSLKNLSQDHNDFPVQMLCLENQNLYYQIIDIDQTVIQQDQPRLVQAQVFLLALCCNEILNRAIAHLDPPPDPTEIDIDFIIKDRYLATVIVGDRLLSSSMLTRTDDEDFILLMSRGRSLIARGRNQLQRMFDRHSDEMIEQHFALRRDLMAWCREFIEYDLDWRKKNFPGTK
jgi:ComEC/Rec2-related protein